MHLVLSFRVYASHTTAVVGSWRPTKRVKESSGHWFGRRRFFISFFADYGKLATMFAANSDVLPTASVAVAVMIVPTGTRGKVAVK